MRRVGPPSESADRIGGVAHSPAAGRIRNCAQAVKTRERCSSRARGARRNDGLSSRPLQTARIGAGSQGEGRVRLSVPKKFWTTGQGRYECNELFLLRFDSRNRRLMLQVNPKHSVCESLKRRWAVGLRPAYPTSGRSDIYRGQNGVDVFSISVDGEEWLFDPQPKKDVEKRVGDDSHRDEVRVIV